MKKKIIAIILAAFTTTMLFVGCNNDDKTNSSKETSSTKEIDENDDTSKKDDSSKNNDSTSENKKIDNNEVSDSKKVKGKDEYLQKLESIKEGLHDLDSLYAGSTVDMKNAAAQEYNRWDDALNEIYNYLKKNLDKETSGKLSVEEALWIKTKEDTAKNDSKQYEGGTMEGLEYMSSLASSTKDRCYELVNKYME